MPLPAERELEISPADLAANLDEVCLVDCRELEEFALCKIEGAELVPLSQFAEIALPKLENETRPIVVY